MTPPSAAAVRPYHHGDLRNALVQAGVELAREGGPGAIVLREAARRVGVSPNAAYRHFTSLPDLVHAVARESLTALAGAMQKEIDRLRPSGDPQQDAWGYVMAVGRGYVRFALSEPGLFTTAFDRSGLLGPPGVEVVWTSPQDLLTKGLQGLVEVGLLPPADIEAGRMLAWSSVHGLSQLLLGPMNELPKRARDQLIEMTLQQVGSGLLSSGVSGTSGGLPPAAGPPSPAARRARVPG